MHPGYPQPQKGALVCQEGAGGGGRGWWGPSAARRRLNRSRRGLWGWAGGVDPEARQKKSPPLGNRAGINAKTEETTGLRS